MFIYILQVVIRLNLYFNMKCRYQYNIMPEGTIAMRQNRYIQQGTRAAARRVALANCRCT